MLLLLQPSDSAHTHPHSKRKKKKGDFSLSKTLALFLPIRTTTSSLTEIDGGFCKSIVSSSSSA